MRPVKLSAARLHLVGDRLGGPLRLRGHEAERTRAACVANEAQAGSRGFGARDGWPPASVQDTEVANQRLERSAVAGRADDRVGLDTALPPARMTPAESSDSTAPTTSTVPSLTASITSLSTIAGTVPSRRKRRHEPLLGDGKAIVAEIAEILAASDAGERVPEPGREVQQRRADPLARQAAGAFTRQDRRRRSHSPARPSPPRPSRCRGRSPCPSNRGRPPTRAST